METKPSDCATTSGGTVRPIGGPKKLALVLLGFILGVLATLAFLHFTSPGLAPATVSAPG